MSKKAIAHLSQDPLFKEIIEVTKISRSKSDGDAYTSLIRAIVYQQLSGKAAGTIHERFLALFKNGYPEAKHLIRFSEEELRAVGLSRQKGSYIQNVANFWIDNKLKNTDWKKLSDDEIIEMLTEIKGVGVWTVQMLLMSTLKRPDVFPTNDLGINNAIIKRYRLRSKGKQLTKRILKISEAWSPYRSTACLYLWRWIDDAT